MKNKVIMSVGFAIIVLVIGLFWGWSVQQEQPKWSNISINGSPMEFPMEYKALQQAEIEITEEQEENWESMSDTVIDPNQFTGSYEVINNEYYKLNVGIGNITDASLEFQDCNIVYLRYLIWEKGREDYDSANIPSVVIGDSITFGSTDEEVVAAFGELDEIIEDTDSSEGEEKYVYRTKDLTVRFHLLNHQLRGVEYRYLQ